MTIIALTGWGQEVDRAQSKEAGCDCHLVKPVNLSDLEKLLAELQRSPGRRPGRRSLLPGVRGGAARQIMSKVSANQGAGLQP